MRFSAIELEGDDIEGDFVSVALDDAGEPEGECFDVYVWRTEPSSTQALQVLEMLGNKTVKLVGRYRFRYDPGRTASTGAGQTPRDDFHLYDGGVEIAAWDDEGKARHGFKSGHRLPKKAYDALVKQYPSLHGLKGRLLEHLRRSRALHEDRTTVSIEDLEEGAD